MKRIENPSLDWSNGNQPISKDFNDVYFSRADGLAETHTVFIKGNDLPQRWQNEPKFTIAETGFGTGLNFLATWQLFEQTRTNDQRLDFISVERYPLHKDDLRRALEPWRDTIGVSHIDRLINCYPLRSAGFHRIWITSHVTLTLIFDDALRALKQLDCTVDAWYLDGFSPAKNESLWQQDLFCEIARLSRKGTTLASFTAAGHVRRGLEDVGFSVTRAPGFANKRHRITGLFQKEIYKTQVTIPSSVTIIGAGLAGAALYHTLTRRGIDCRIVEKQSAAAMGASGNSLGLINPKIEAQDNARTDLGLSAFSFASHILNDTAYSCDYKKTGALHLVTDDDKENKLRKIYDSGYFLDPHCKWIEHGDSSNVCGISLDLDGLYYADSGTVNTQKFVRYLLQDAEITYNSSWDSASASETTVLCAGWELNTLNAFPLQPVRGQVVYIQKPIDTTLKCPIMFGSYIAPYDDETWSLGATFTQNNDDPNVRSEDTEKILQSIARHLPHKVFTVKREWANVRTATRDRYPLVGPLAIDSHQYILGGLGSHGIQFSLLLAEILACQLTNAPLPVGRDALKAVHTSRFWKKA